MLAASKRIAEQEARLAELQGQSQVHQPSPATPSGMVPIYTKPNTPKRRKKPGAKKGHPGHRRKPPARIDEHKTHRLKRCSGCGGPLQRCERKRTRIIEDIPEEIEPVVTEHTIWRDYCPKCKKHVEPVVPDALPRAPGGSTVTTTYDYDGYGRLTWQVEDDDGGMTLTSKYYYSSFNEMTKSVDPRGVVRVMKYDYVGRLTQQYTLANLSLEGSESGNALEETQYTFNSNGHLEFVKVADDNGPFTPGSPAGWFETEYEYDIYGRRTKMIVEGTLETVYEYDNQNRIVKTTTPGGVWTKIERDGRGLQTAQVIGYDADTEVLRTEYEYDANGNLTKITEPSGRTTTYVYDMFDRRTKATVDEPQE